MYIRLPVEQQDNNIVVSSLEINAENLTDLVDKVQKSINAKLTYYQLQNNYFVCDQAEALRDKVLELEPERSNNEEKKASHLEQVKKSS